MKKLDRRVRRTRRLLHSSLHELILEKGYEAITVQDITDRADLSRATFYLHYKDKDELLAQSLEDMFDDLVAPMENQPIAAILDPDSPSPSLIAFQHVQEHADLYRVLLGEHGVSSVIYRAMDYLARYAEQSIIERIEQHSSPDLPLPLISHHIAGSLFALLVWWLEQGMPYPPEEMSYRFQQLALPGVANVLDVAYPPGQEDL